MHIRLISAEESGSLPHATLPRKAILSSVSLGLHIEDPARQALATVVAREKSPGIWARIAELAGGAMSVALSRRRSAAIILPSSALALAFGFSQTADA